ncbi:MAG: YdeI/OmpD-associated family protein [Candidatus Bathyarchaeota archaeon]|nr:MAG: YdeI/OmpD-associated family protein [Candidatus Bathyarchaeota archaeon]
MEKKPLRFRGRKEWRSWLQKNHLSEKAVWLVIYKKQSKKQSIAYNDAVEEAVCFGWIDGQIKRIDDERFIQRYTPRRPQSRWSESNIERAERMIKQGYMTKEGLEIYKKGIENKQTVPSSKKFTVPPDLKSALTKNKTALTNFQNLAPSAQLAYAYWVDTAKREETRQRRIKKSVDLLAQNKKLGEN